MRLRVEGAPDEFLFAKLYTKGHVRADRWYKLWRTILYGSLEDESPFKTVRRLVTYEDYALRLLQDIGVRTARPYGIVEITPEREYMLVTEFHAGAVEIGEADVDDAVIDQGLQLIRLMWDAGIAHRDIKPGNLMVRAGELLLIDVAFVQVRPSPWRQAVDLGNMMLVLAVRTGPQRVYRRALAYFTEAELAEAFAATRGVASPTQLRAFMKRDPRDLLGEFRALAPARPPITLQRWSVKRIALAAAMLAIIIAAVFETGDVFFPAARNLGARAPTCGTGHSMILSAQAVPSAALLPCIAALPSGWTIGGADIASGKASFGLDSDRAGERAATITLTAACDTTGARQIPSDQPGTRRFERPLSLAPQFSSLRIYTFPGGCVTYQFSFTPGASPCWAMPPAAPLIPATPDAGRFCPAHRRPCAVRARRRVPRMSRETAPSAGAARAGGARKPGRWLTRWWFRTPDGRVYQRRWAGVQVAAAGLGVVIVCGVLVANQLLAGPDVALFHRINHWPGWLYPPMWVVQLSGVIGALPLLAAAAALLRRFRLAAALAAATLLKVSLEAVAKTFVQRGRPAETVPDVILRGNSAAHGLSFPSGHAMVIFAITALVTPYLKGWLKVLPWALAAAVCLSRAYLGAHYPLDVVAGAGLGILIGAVLNLIFGVPSISSSTPRANGFQLDVA